MCFLGALVPGSIYEFNKMREDVRAGPNTKRCTNPLFVTMLDPALARAGSKTHVERFHRVKQTEFAPLVDVRQVPVPYPPTSKKLHNFQIFCTQGVPEAPRCGFSNAVVQIMRMHDVPFKSYNVLADEEIRCGYVQQLLCTHE